MSRAANLQRTFDDLALTQQGVVLEPLLQAISDFLDDHEGLITTIQGDLRRGLKNPDTGRKGSSGQEGSR
jgi:transposase, IS5 family